MASSADRVAMFLLLVGCGAEPETSAPPVAADSATLAERPCPEDSIVSYESFGGPFLLDWCTGCHAAGLPDGSRQGAPLGVDFDDLEAARKHAARIWARAADGNATMPPVGGPDEEERTRLGEWLACGAPTDVDIRD